MGTQQQQSLPVQLKLQQQPNPKPTLNFENVNYYQSEKNNLSHEPIIEQLDLQQKNVKLNEKLKDQLQFESHDYWMVDPCSSIGKKYDTEIEFIWAETNPNNSKQLLQQLNQSYDIIYCKSIEQAYLKVKDSQNKLYNLIISFTTIEQLKCKELFKYPNVYNIYVVYGKQNHVISQIVNSNRLKNSISKIRFYEDMNFQVLYPFFLNNQTQNCLHRLRDNLHTFRYMRNQNSAKTDFIQLLQEIYPYNNKQVEEFIQDYFSAPGQPNNIIKWYKKQNFYAKSLNVLPIITDNPLELAYIRLPFIDMFNAIKKLYKKQSNQDFQVYKGGWISERDLELLFKNQGKSIEILNFICGNRYKNQAEANIKNALFIIKVQKNRRDEQLDYGYADIITPEKNTIQKQVIFNALNTFKIQKVESRNGINIIHLKYGQIAHLYSKSMITAGLNEFQKLQIQNYKLLKQNLQLISNQGDLLKKCQQYDRAILYYLSFIDYLKQKGIDVKSNKNMITIFYGLGRSYQVLKEYEKSFQYYQKFLAIQNQNINQNDQRTAQIYQNIAEVYMINREQDKSLKYYLISLSIWIQKMGKQVQIAQTHDIIGRIYKDKMQYEKGNSYLLKASKIYVNLYGDNHILTAKVYFNIAEINKIMENYEISLDYYYRCLNTFINIYKQYDPLIISIYKSLGDIYFKIGQDKKTLEFYDKYLKVNTLHDTEVLEIIYQRIGQLYYRNNDQNKSLQYLLKYIKLIPKSKSNLDVISAYQKVADLLKNKKEYQKSLQYFHKLLALNVSIFGQAHQSNAQIYFNISEVYRLKQQYDNALKNVQAALNIWMSIKNDSYQQIIRSYKFIALIYREQKDYDNCLKNYIECMKMVQQINGEGHPMTIAIYNNVGQIYRIKKDYEKSLYFYEKCLKNDQKLEIEVLKSSIYNNVAILYDEMCEYNKALFYYFKSLEIEQKYTKDQNSKQLATKYNNIGSIYHSKGQYNNALEYYYKCLKCEIKLKGETHLQTAATYNNIGLVYEAQENYNKAYKYFNQCLNICLKEVGDNSLQMSNINNCLGVIERERGNYDKALQYHFKSLNTFFKLVGQNHQFTAKSYNCIGLVYRELDQYHKALDYYSKALKIEQSVFGDTHLVTGITYGNIGQILSKKEDKQAIQFLYKSLNILLASVGNQHTFIGIIYRKIGENYIVMNQKEKSNQYLMKSLKILRSSLKQEHSHTALSYSALGYYFLKNKEFDSALENFKNCLNIQQKIFNEDHPLIGMSCFYIGWVYQQKRNFEESIKNLQKSKEILQKKYNIGHQRLKNIEELIKNCNVVV